MPNTMTLIQAVTVGSGGASSISFTSIPSTYTDLILYTSTRAASTGANWALMSVNSTSDTTIDLKHMIADGNTVATQAYGSGRLTNNQNGFSANTFAYAKMYMPNYLNTSRNKSMAVLGAQTNNTSSPRPSCFITSLKWNNNAAVNSIVFTLDGGGNFAQYSTAYLYGISNT